MSADPAPVSHPSRRSGHAPAPGPSIEHFRCIGERGISDQLNAYPHSMKWHNNRLIVGTTRANMCALRVSKVKTNIGVWPVQCPDNLYDLDMRAQIHAWSAEENRWTELLRSPLITGRDGTIVPRELGYRGMTAFQGESDETPALYISTYASARGYGCNILRTVDCETFEPIPMPKEFGDFVLTLRLLVPFKGRLFTSPTGRAGDPNTSNFAAVFETRDPLRGEWRMANEPAFGDRGNLSVFELLACGDYLYAGTANFGGYQLWRTDGEGDPPYRWERILAKGAWRGKENQGVASLCEHEGALYVGSGIQHGGIDVVNKTGPAGPELVRVHPDGSWDLIVGAARDTPAGRKTPLSGYGPGFDSFFTGYFWRMGSHDGWLYLGTFRWSLIMNYSVKNQWPEIFRRIHARIGADEITRLLGGAELYRSADGENWLPVTQDGFGNPYNYGIRGIEPTPHGVAIGTVNPFAPRIAKLKPDGSLDAYVDNPRGGLEIWLGRRPDA